MFESIIAIIAVLSVLLTLVVLAQNPKGGGLSSAFGGSGASQMIGAKRTTDLLEKVTWGFLIGVFILAMGVTTFLKAELRSPNSGGFSSPNVEAAQEKTLIEETPETPDGAPVQLPGTETAPAAAPTEEAPAPAEDGQ